MTYRYKITMGNKVIECSDCRKQQDKIPREELASPTVHLESVLITSIIWC